MNDCFQLPAEFNIYTAIETRDALAAWLTEKQAKGMYGELRVSAREVNEVDGAGLQILAALSNSGESWRLVQASTPFVRACEAMGLSHWVQALESGASKETP